MSGDEFANLLLPNERILWAASPVSYNKVIFNILFLVISLVSLSFSAWLLYGILVPPPSDAFGGNSPLFATISAAAFGLFGLWVVATDRGVVKETAYLLTNLRAFSAESRQDTRALQVRFIDRGRLLHIERTSRRMMVAVPVKLEPGEKIGYLYFDGLTHAEGERVSAFLNSIIGEAPDAS